MLKYFIPPKEGLKINTYYVVEVSFFPGNPIHKAILGVAFLNERTNLPSHGTLFSTNYTKESVRYTEAYYIKVVREIDTQIPNIDKQVKDLQNIFELEQHNIQRTNK